jgi:uncharacterized protein (DUF302 family)
MDRWIDMAILMGGWIALQAWILPRLGMSTCMVPRQPRSALPAEPEETNMQGYGMRQVLTGDFDHAIERVTEALKTEGFGVLTDIDVQATLKKKIDVDFRKYRILGACNPPFAHRALTADLDVGLLLPCNVIVYQDDDGQNVVSAVDPAQMIPSDGNPALAALAQDVRGRLQRAIALLA